MVNQVLQQRRIQDGGSLEFLASDGRADNGEDTGSDDRADAQGGEADPAQRFFQAEFRVFTVRNQLVDVLATEKR